MNDNKNKKSAKSFFSIQWSVLWCFTLIATLLVMVWVSARVMVPNWKIFYTQLRMAQCYSTIQNLEGTRDSNLEKAYTYPGGATGYVAAAEEADEQIEVWEGIRSSYVHNEDPVIAQAAKDGFEFDLFVFSLLKLLLVIAAWVAFFLLEWFYTMVFAIVQLEVLLICVIMSSLFRLLSFVFGRLSTFFANEQNCFMRYRKMIIKDLRRGLGVGEKAHKTKKGDNIHPFEFSRPERRRRIG